MGDYVARVLRALYNARASGRAMKMLELNNLVGGDYEDLRRCLLALEHEHFVRVSLHRHVTLVALTPSGCRAVEAGFKGAAPTNIVVNDGHVQIGNSNVQELGDDPLRVNGDIDEDDDESFDEDDEDDEDALGWDDDDLDGVG